MAGGLISQRCVIHTGVSIPPQSSQKSWVLSLVLWAAKEDGRRSGDTWFTSRCSTTPSPWFPTWNPCDSLTFHLLTSSIQPIWQRTCPRIEGWWLPDLSSVLRWLHFKAPHNFNYEKTPKRHKQAPRWRGFGWQICSRALISLKLIISALNKRVIH